MAQTGMADAQPVAKRRFKWNVSVSARVIAVLLMAVYAQACGCVSYSNRLFIGHRPPEMLDLAKQLCSKPNKPVSRLGRELGFATTPFKRLGIFGWRDLGIDVSVVGYVSQSVVSTDHFITVDLQIEQLVAGGQPLELVSQRYLRAEICQRELALPRPLWPCVGDKVRIGGRLVWDGDGFLEVHPMQASEVEILQKNINGQGCP